MCPPVYHAQRTSVPKSNQDVFKCVSKCGKGPTLAVLMCKDKNLSCLRGHQKPQTVVPLVSAGSPFGFALWCTFPGGMDLCTEVLSLCKPLLNQQEICILLHLLIQSNIHQVPFFSSELFLGTTMKSSLNNTWASLISRAMHRDHLLLVGTRGAWQQPQMNYKQTPNLSRLK